MAYIAQDPRNKVPWGKNTEQFSITKSTQAKQRVDKKSDKESQCVCGFQCLQAATHQECFLANSGA